jgi:hypothetical protein
MNGKSSRTLFPDSLLLLLLLLGLCPCPCPGPCMEPLGTMLPFMSMGMLIMCTFTSITGMPVVSSHITSHHIMCVSYSVIGRNEMLLGSVEEEAVSIHSSAKCKQHLAV